MSLFTVNFCWNTAGFSEITTEVGVRWFQVAIRICVSALTGLYPPSYQEPSFKPTLTMLLSTFGATSNFWPQQPWLLQQLLNTCIFRRLHVENFAFKDHTCTILKLYDCTCKDRTIKLCLKFTYFLKHRNMQGKRIKLQKEKSD